VAAGMWEWAAEDVDVRMGASFQPQHYRIDPVIAGSDRALFLEASCAGRDVMLAMDISMEAEIKAGRLCRVLPQWAGPPQELNALHPQERVPSPRSALRFVSWRRSASPLSESNIASLALEVLTRRPQNDFADICVVWLLESHRARKLRHRIGVAFETTPEVRPIRGLVGFRVERRQATLRRGQDDVRTGVPEHVVGRCQLFEPESGLATCTAEWSCEVRTISTFMIVALRLSRHRSTARFGVKRISRCAAQVH